LGTVKHEKLISVCIKKLRKRI